MKSETQWYDLFAMLLCRDSISVCLLQTSHMAECPDEYKWFVDEDRPWEEYLQEMRQDGVWGGNIEVQAASMTLKMNIVVHQCDEHVPRMVIRNWADVQGKPARTLHLAYHGAEHYNSVRLRSDIVVGEPALQFDLDSLIASGGSDPGEVASAAASVKAHSASAKAAICPDLHVLHQDVTDDVDSGAALPQLHTAAVSKLLRNTAHFQGRTRAYVAALLQRVQCDDGVATECLNRIAFEVLAAGVAEAPPAAAAAQSEAAADSPKPARTKARLSNKERRALRKAAKFEQAAADVQLASAPAASGGASEGTGDAAAASVQRAIQAAAAASLQRGSGKRVASTYTDKKALDI